MLSLIAMWGKGLGLTKRVEFSLITRPFFFLYYSALIFYGLFLFIVTFLPDFFLRWKWVGGVEGEDKCVLC